MKTSERVTNVGYLPLSLSTETMKKFETFEALNEDEETSVDQLKSPSDDAVATCQNEVFILGGKLLCSDVFSLMSKVDQLRHIETIEIQTVMDKFTDPFKAEKGSSAAGKKPTKSRSIAHQQEQKRSREKSAQKQNNSGKSKERRSGSSPSNEQLNEFSVITESLDSLVSDDGIKTRFPPIIQAKETSQRAILKRKQGAEKLPASGKEFLPSLNIKAKLIEKTSKRSQVNHLPSLISKKGLSTKTSPPSPESTSESSSTPQPENAASTVSDAISVSSDASPIISRKKPTNSRGGCISPQSPLSPRKPTPFPSIWGEDRFFKFSFENNVLSKKAKAYAVKEETE